MTKTTNFNMQERFESKIERIPECGCWIWMGVCDKDGYGKSKISGKNMLTHRAIWGLYNGIIPKDIQVLHNCDTPACINPYHLFLGTNTINMRDKAKKGRSAKGELVPASKLTESQVIKIRNDNRLHRIIGNEYGVCRSAISLIKSRKNWKHI